VPEEIDITQQLERLISKCLAKDPIDRPQSAALLRQALEEWIFGDAWDEDQARLWWETSAPCVRSDAVSMSNAAAVSGTQVTA
jgi:serine/threonine protein kinase